LTVAGTGQGGTTVLRTSRRVIDLGPADLPRVRRLCARNPTVNAFVEHRAHVTGLDQRRLGGSVWGYVEQGELLSACHVGANLVPVEATPQAVAAFGEQAAALDRTCSSMVGPACAVLPLWELLEASWGPAREVRAEQPFLAVDTVPAIRPDPAVRRLGIDELDLLYPASVAMFTEEVGVSPELEGPSYYRARVAQLLTRGWCFARVERDRIVFKAEIGLATSGVCQVQGVYVDPEFRGRGIAAPAMAAVVSMALASIAPVVTLYVNAGNVAARAAYARTGFVQTATFSTVLF